MANLRDEFESISQNSRRIYKKCNLYFFLKKNLASDDKYVAIASIEEKIISHFPQKKKWSLPYYHL